MTQAQFLATRSVPLAKDTMEAWRKQGVIFRRRGRLKVWDTRYHEPHIQAVINLGNLDMQFGDVPVPVFNQPSLIRAISAPFALRTTMGDMLPEYTHKGPHWHKTNGYKGVGKKFLPEFEGGCAVIGSESQRHVTGIEYRVISVGDKIVQASKKMPINEGWPPIPTGFEFEWVGVKGIAKTGIIPYIHEAIKFVPFSKYSIIGWDVIVTDIQPYIIEANTSPGVNEATAERIISVVKEII
jgi:hypothetical protein